MTSSSGGLTCAATEQSAFLRCERSREGSVAMTATTRSGLWLCMIERALQSVKIENAPIFFAAAEKNRSFKGSHGALSNHPNFNSKNKPSSRTCMQLELCRTRIYSSARTAS
jgi:hypothetical protein